MKHQHVFDDLKLRLGWGKVGNQNIDNSAYISSISTTRYTLGATPATIVGSTIGSIGNTNVKWETVEDYNIGLDMAFLANRLRVTGDWYTKKSHDMLMQKENLLILGYPMWNGQMWENIGSMKATGWELGIDWNDHVGGLQYGVGVNLRLCSQQSHQPQWQLYLHWQSQWRLYHPQRGRKTDQPVLRLCR